MSFVASVEHSARRRCERSPTGPAFPTRPSSRQSIDSRSGASATRRGRSCSISSERHCPRPRRRRPLAFSRRGTQRSWYTLAGPRSCRNTTGHWSSTPRRHIPSRPSWSMAPSPEPGAMRAAGSRSSHSSLCQKPRAERSRTRRNGWRRSINKAAPHDGALLLFEGRSLAALSGLRRPRGRLLRLTGRLRGPVLARLAATLLLRPLLARLRLPALVAVLLLALAHAKFLLPNKFVAPGALVRPPSESNIWPEGVFRSPVSELSRVAAAQPRLRSDSLSGPPRTVPGSVTSV